ncbi:restriction endonuclease subunit S [Faecalibacterium prausnitzii]|uniref:restriction endonuclease subunit S n=1 Tax=Faecalibacterium prausnitzii TaxID=853 RepID=UPI003A7FC12B
MKFDIWKECPKVPLPSVLLTVVDNRGKTVPTAPSGHKLIATNCVRNENLYPVYEKIRYLSEETYRTWFRAHPEPGDIIFVCKGTPGRVCLVPDPIDFCIAQDMVALRADPKIVYNKYLLAVLRSFQIQEQILSTSVGDVIPHFKKSFFDQIMIPIPNMDIQKSIGDFYYTISEKTELNKKINDNLLEQMQALYKSWFVDYRPFGGVMPTSWTQNGIYSLANIIYGAPFASKQFNTEGNGKPIIRIRDLKDQQFATYTTEVHPKGYLLHPGDIVVGMDGEFRPYIWGNDEAWLNQRVCVFENKRPNGKAFLYFTIKPLLFAIEQTQVATTVIHIGKKDFDTFEIMLPDTELLDAFDAITTPMVEQIVSNSIENKRLAIMRDALLPKLMSGEIDVSDIQL